MAKSIPSEFRIESKDGMSGGDVHEWRASLQAGFDNAFPKSSAQEKLELRLEMVEFSFAPTAMTDKGRAVAVEGHIRYRGRWVSDAGELPIAATVASKASGGDANDLAKSAIESMYEDAWRRYAASPKP